MRLTLLYVFTFVIFVLHYEAKAQNVQVGYANLVNTNNPITISNVNQVTKSRSANIYTAAEILQQGGYAGLINKIAWYRNKPSGVVFANNTAKIKVYIKQINYQTFDSASKSWLLLINSSQLVYSDSLFNFDQYSGWKFIDFQNSFLWNGTSNLLVLVDFESTQIGSSTMSWKSSNVSNASAYQSSQFNVAMQHLGRSSLRPNTLFNFVNNFNDVSVSDFSYIPGKCIGDSSLMSIKINNHTDSIIRNVQVNWSIDNQAPNNFIYSINIAPSSSNKLDLTYFKFLSSNAGNVKIWTSNPNNSPDLVPQNDTINVSISPAMSGVYQVSNNSELKSLAEVIDALNKRGICSSVQFSFDSTIGVQNGPFNLSNIIGNNSFNSISFIGNGTIIQANLPQSIIYEENAVWSFHHVQNINIIGYRFKYINNHSSASILTFADSTSNIQLKRNYFYHDYIGRGNSINARSISEDGTISKVNLHNFLIDSNEFVQADNAIFIEALSNISDSIKINRNKFKDFASSAIAIKNINDLIISYNDINSKLNMSTLALSTIQGLVISDVQNLTINNNKIHALLNKSNITNPIIRAIYLNVVSNAIVSNNLIYDVISTLGNYYGIYVNSSDSVALYYNLISSGAGTNFTSAFTGIAKYQTPKFKVLNNIVHYIKNSSYTKRLIYYDLLDSTLVSNNNAFVLKTVGGGQSYVGGSNLGDYNTLFTWNLASPLFFDSKSTDQDPLFVDINQNNYRVQSIYYDAKGSFIPSVTIDFDDQLRDPVNPDIGPYEFSPAPLDIEVSNVRVSSGTCTYPQQIIVDIKSLGAVLIDSIAFDWSVDGVLQPRVKRYGHIAQGSQGVFTLGTYSLSAGTSYLFKAWVANVNNQSDVNSLNDTTVSTIAYKRYSGTFTVGGPNADFESPKAALDSLNKNGICSSVVLNINPNYGPYNDRIIIQNIIGLSSNSTLTINGNGSKINFNTAKIVSNDANDLSAIQINGADYVDINSLYIQLEGDKNAESAIQIMNASNNITIRDNYLFEKRSSSLAQSYGILVSSGTPNITNVVNVNNLNLLNNKITEFSNGIYFNGASNQIQYSNNNKINGNRIVAFKINGVYLLNMDDTKIENNEFSMNRVDSAISFSVKAISITGMRKTTLINANIIHDIFLRLNNGQANAVLIQQCVAANNNRVIISNNIIYNIFCRNLSVFQMTSSNNVDFIHNSISLKQIQSNSNYVGFSLFFVGNELQSVNIKNNALLFDSTVALNSIALNVSPSNTSFSFASNNNCFRVTNSNLQFNVVNTPYTFSAWKSVFNKDLNTIILNPNFQSSVLLIPRLNSALINAGTVVNNVTKDFMGNVRSLNSPTIGAYELGQNDVTGPQVNYNAIPNTFDTSNYHLLNYFSINDISGLDTSLNNKPKLFYKRKTDENLFINNQSGVEGWKYVESSNQTSPFTFTIDYSKLKNQTLNAFDAFEYFILAKDKLGNYSISDGTSKSMLAGQINFTNLFPISNTKQYFIIDTLPSLIKVGINEKVKSITNDEGLFHMLNINPISKTTVIVNSDLYQETGKYSLEKLNVINQLNSNIIITIKPDKDTTYNISGNAIDAILKFKGAQKIQIGRDSVENIDFRIVNNNVSPNAAIVNIYSPSYFKQISNDIIISNVQFIANSTQLYAIKVGESINPNSSIGKGAANVNISKNNFFGFKNAIYGTSDSSYLKIQNLTISENLFVNESASSLIDLYFSDSLYIRKNRFNINRFASSSNDPNSAISTTWCNNYEISGNNIQINLSENVSHSEIKVISIFGKYNSNGASRNIYNNVINVFSNINTDLTNNISLIYLDATENVNIYHNSISLAGFVKKYSSNYISAISLNKSNAINIYNNSIQNTLPGVLERSYLYYSTQMNLGVVVMNNNQFYSKASQLFFEQNQSFNNFNSWVSYNQQNSNSIFSDAKLNLQSLKSTNNLLLGMSSNTFNTLFDIDGNNRRIPSAIGAYEIDSVYTDLVLEEIITPTLTFKTSGIQDITIVISNYGLSPINNFNIDTKIDVNGNLLSYSYTYNKSLLPGMSDTIMVAAVNVSDITDAGDLLIYTNVLNDINASNDTLRMSFCKSYIIANSLLNSKTVNVCEGQNYKFELNDPLNRELRWYDSEEGGNLVYIGNSFDVKVSKDLKYYAQVMSTQAIDSLTTSPSLNYGVPAVMFNIVNTNSFPVYFNRLELNTYSMSASTIPHTKIYVRNGSFSAAEFNIQGWTYLDGFSQEFFDGPNGLTLSNEVLIPAGATLGVFITSTSGVWMSSTEYTLGTPPTYSKAGLDITPGKGKVSPNIAHTSIPNVVPHLSIYFRSTDECSYIPRVKYEVNRKFSIVGSDIAANSNNIYVNDGTIDNPDILCNSQTINYKIKNTTIYNDLNYNQSWRVVYKEIVSIDKKFRIVSSIDTNRTISFISSELYKGDLILIRFRLLNINTQCEITYDRYARIQPDLNSISLGNDTIVCTGDVIRLSAGNIPGVTYLWSNGDTSSSILINKAGTYSLTVTYGICKQLFDEIIVRNYITEDSLDYSYSNVGCNYVFTAPLIDDVKYYWSFGDGSIDSGRVVNHIFLIEKLFKVKLRVVGKGTTCLTSKTNTKSINVSCFVGINNEEIVDINIYPIPSNKVINFSANKQIENIEVYDLQGRIIESFNTQQHSFENYASGVYLIRMTINNKQYYRKIIIEN